jgi:hypothetical protein
VRAAAKHSLMELVDVVDSECVKAVSPMKLGGDFVLAYLSLSKVQ